jgi:hypothetical protein
MRWLNIEIATLRSPAFVGAEPVERATWLSLLAYCADQENGGVIKGCRNWKDRQWQQTCGITLNEAQLEAQLWEWIGDDLRVEFYPTAKESEIRAKRQAGASGGRASGEARREAQLEAQLQPQLEAHLERKGKEWKVKERNRNGKEETIFPDNLDNDAFRKAWEDYLAYRKASRMKPLLPTSVAAQLKKLSEWGNDAALESLNQTISNGWQGLFPPKSNKAHDNSNSRTSKRDREIDGHRKFLVRTI